jgi:FemAB-related protein (PEP-CTERM system-associated)
VIPAPIAIGGATTTSPSPSLRVNNLTTIEEDAWENYALQHHSATVFHTITWKRVIERAFGFPPMYLFVSRAGRVCGILPLFLVSNPVIGKVLISTPFAVYGGPCGDDRESCESLLQGASSLADSLGVQYLELRNREYSPGNDRFQRKDLYIAFDCELPNSSEALIKGFPRDTRYMIRKAQKNGLTSVLDNNRLDDCYDLYAESVTNLGTPVFGKKYFQILREEFGESLEVMVIEDATGSAVAAALSFRFRDWVIPYYGGSGRKGRSVAANNFMYWEIMRSAIEKGIRYYDFGRSKLNTGSHFFKTQWNMREYPLPYHFLLVRRAEKPNFSPANSRFRPAIDLWKRIPVPLAKLIGPQLIKLFP